jgi:hypothetical protein
VAYKEFLVKLNGEPWFSKFAEDVLKPAIPEVPSYNPREDNTDRWKYDSAMREGFLMCLSLLGVKND